MAAVIDPAGLSRRLYYGDNLENLRTYVGTESVDLCYIDPPFNSKRNYNQIYNNIGQEDSAQAQSFVDTWGWTDPTQQHYDEIVTNASGRFNEKTIELIRGLHSVLKPGSLFAYLVEMTVRIVEIHRVLKKTGSFYIHCDPTASHYLKIVCDGIFITGGGCYHNEIVWRRTGAHGKSQRFAPIHDLIFFYSKSNQYTWTYPVKPYMNGHVKEYFVQDELGWRTNYYGNVLTGSGRRGGESGKPWRGFDPTAKNRHWAIPGKLVEELDEDVSGMTQHEKLDFLYERGFIKIVEGQAWPIYERRIRPGDGQAIPDIWAFQPYTEGTVFGTQAGIDEDVRWLSPVDQERLHYETQKPEALLERIIGASTREGDLVLDAFCGCGTTIAVAEQMSRSWIGIDITYQAIAVILRRLEKRFQNYGILDKINLHGIPKDMASAVALANKKEDRVRKEFEKWCVLTYTSNRAAINEKKGADAGIDGTAYFLSSTTKDTGKMVFQVKSGGAQRSTIATLNSDRLREKAEMATLIVLEKPTAAMVKEASQVGAYQNELMASPLPIIQIVLVEDILKGARLQLPMSLEVLKSAKLLSRGGQLDLLEDAT